MTAVRLSPLQRQVLDQLAHIRVAPEDAWLSSERLKTLTGRDFHIFHTLQSLRGRDLVERNPNLGLWRITDKGREALG